MAKLAKMSLKLPNISEMPELSDDEEAPPEFDAGVCFPIQDGGFSFRKSFKKMNSKKLSGTVDFRLKTNVTKALLKENACDDRKLRKHLDLITTNQNKRAHEQNLQQISFTFHSRKRRESWTRDDRVRLDRLNFPVLRANDRKLQSASVQQVYKTPENLGRTSISVPLFPVMFGKTEPKIIEYKNHTYLTKQPSMYELHPRQQHRYNRYKGVNLLSSRTVNDERFQRLSTALSEAKLSVGNGRIERPELETEPSPPKKRSQFLPDMDDLQSASHKNTRSYLTRAATTYM